VKIYVVLMIVFILGACSSNSKDWDSGAQRQESMEDETRSDQQSQFRNQFPSQLDY